MPLVNTQSNWRWCTQCQGLWYAGHGNRGACSAGGGLHVQGPANYNLVHTSPADPGQHGWRWCGKCEGLWYGGSQPSDRSWCPYDEGAHSMKGSVDYSLDPAPGGNGEYGWRWCSQCQGLWFAGNGGSKGRCPKYGAPHSVVGSRDYNLVQVG